MTDQRNGGWKDPLIGLILPSLTTLVGDKYSLLMYSSEIASLFFVPRFPGTPSFLLHTGQLPVGSALEEDQGLSACLALFGRIVPKKAV